MEPILLKDATSCQLLVATDPYFSNLSMYNINISFEMPDLKKIWSF